MQSTYCYIHSDHCMHFVCVTLCYICVGEVGASRPYPGGDLWVTVHCARGVSEEVCRLPSTAGKVRV